MCYFVSISEEDAYFLKIQVRNNLWVRVNDRMRFDENDVDEEKAAISFAPIKI